MQTLFRVAFLLLMSTECDQKSQPRRADSLSPLASKGNSKSSDVKEYRVQTGEIELNDTEITILINNSTYEIFEYIEANSTEVEENVAKMIEKQKLSSTSVKPMVTTTVTTRRPRNRYHKFRPAHCRHYTTKDKFLLLEKAGSRNQFYMADSPEEAAKNFAPLLPYPQDKTAEMFADQIQAEIDFDHCDARCEMIKELLLHALNSTTPTPRHKAVSTPLNDAVSSGSATEGGGEERTTPLSGGCYLETFIPLGNCTDMGEEVSWNHESLCSVCHGIYMLNGDCFPKFFNSIKCNQQEMGCIFDTFTDKAHGQCHQQSLVFKVLRNKGDERCEDWAVDQIHIPVSCQCTLSRTSWLRSRPQRDL
ncbi:hypothetical protein WR25_24123 isoform A [Diploscapter pachys]|uniref:CTCK domain-containing protein n=1 Tax=Diploscapter pachys TaxID=2018661 RepID=A0A2A2K1R7_9BILA|nr:hypothetical protein WR25_24123 isoform A [Diploscapter pachys]